MNKIKKVVILGGGTAGWMSAALLKKLMGAPVEIELVESEDIGIVGVGEATIPPIQNVNKVLGIDEAEFIRETNATLKLAIKFENWYKQGESYYHTFGAAGKSAPFCHFHHFWNRARLSGDTTSLWQYDLNYLCAEKYKFSVINSQDPLYEMGYAYHFDASLYARYLRTLSEKMGVKRTEGKVSRVTTQAINGNIESLILERGQVIKGDFFIDCSGFRALLIQQTLGTGYEDWSHWLQCDRAIAVPSERHDKTAPYTRSIAHKAGWQWRIPLQHRNGNGLVYCSRHYSDDEATSLLMSNLDTLPLAEPKTLKFTTGRRRKQWHKNVLAVGLASGFLEPLESTSIHLIQSAVTRFAHLFPQHTVLDRRNEAMMAEFNRQSRLETEQIRDFLILHYYLNARQLDESTDSVFWHDMRNLDIPSSLQHKIALFKQDGRLFREQNDLFLESSWLQVMLGQGVTPKAYHPIADNLTETELTTMLENIKKAKSEPVDKMLNHDDFLAKFCGAKLNAQ